MTEVNQNSSDLYTDDVRMINIKEQSKYFLALDLFTKNYTNHYGYRDWLKTPFLLDNTPTATNGYCAMQLPNLYHKYTEYADNILPADALRNLFAKQNNLQFKLDTEAITEAIKKAPKTSPKCETCDGVGTVIWRFDAHRLKHECPVCGGTKIDLSEQAVRDEVYKIKIKDSYFTVQVMQTLVKAALVIKEDVYLLHQENATKPNLLSCGIAQIVVCPSYSVDEDKTLLNLTKP